MKRKCNYKLVLVLSIMLISIIGLIISVVSIISWEKDSRKLQKEINDIQGIVEIREVENTENTEIINEEDYIDKSDPYFDYIGISLIDVSFNELKMINSDVYGWIMVNGTNINYPFVQGKDNSYYLTHSFDKSYNKGGWLFMDYRNNNESFDKNMIIYGHRRANKTMFGTLKNIFTNAWLNNKDNYIVKLSTEKENTLWQVFSIYHIKVTSDYLKVTFENDKDFLDFTDMLIKRSIHSFNTLINENDRILTLSTCYDKNERAVLHAKLIKREAK